MELWGGGLGALTILVAMFFHSISSFLSSKGWYSLVKIIALVGLLCSVYTLINGIYWINWAPPELEPEQAAKITGRRRGGLLLLAFQYWPYVSIAFGGMMSLKYFAHFKNPESIKEDEEDDW